MVNIIVSKTCANDPVKRLLKDFNIAAARGDLVFIERTMTEDVIWHLYEPSGQKEIRGKENVLDEYRHNLVIVPAEFSIDTVITQGDAGAVSGVIRTNDEKSYVFCDVYKFENSKEGKIQDITSYIIEIGINKMGKEK